MFKYTTSLWTSELIIKYEDNIDIDSLVQYNSDLIFKNLPSKHNNLSSLQSSIVLDILVSLVPLKDIIKFGTYDGSIDLTGIFKGTFIYLLDKSIKGKLLISFGHDILTRNYPINLNGLVCNNTCIFCSSNNDVRGKHIKTAGNNIYNSVIVINKNPIIADYEATALVSDNKFKASNNSKIIFLDNDEYNNLKVNHYGFN